MPLKNCFQVFFNVTLRKECKLLQLIVIDQFFK